MAITISISKCSKLVVKKDPKHPPNPPTPVYIIASCGYSALQDRHDVLLVWSRINLTSPGSDSIGAMLQMVVGV